MRVLKAQYVMLAMLLLAVVAFGTGPLLYQDGTFPAVPNASLAYIQHGVQRGMIEPPLLWQVQLVEARMTGPDYFDVQGTAIWRTLFGIPIGTVDAVESSWTYDGVDWQKMMRVWLVLLLVEVVMGLYVGWWIREYWW